MIFRAAGRPWTLLLSWAVCALAGLVWPPRALAHDIPFSYVDLRIRPDGVEAAIKAPSALLTPEDEGRALSSRLTLMVDGAALKALPAAPEITPDGKSVLITLRFPWNASRAHSLHVRCRLFPADPRHRTLLNLYEGETLERQEILDAGFSEFDHRIGGGGIGDNSRRQGTLEVVGKFVAAGVHHIFIGPDHILFIVGLLLLGGRLTQLLKIVTAFTVAHSITLALAALNVVNPPAHVIEPIIALSIVCVGADNLMVLGEQKGRDLRAVLAFGFGFIHGFGFASVLREMDLPRAALGWSLFSFNAGVEIGQACIVLAVAPVLAAVHRRNASLARRVVVAGSLGVIAAGAFWFVQRVRSPG